MKPGPLSHPRLLPPLPEATLGDDEAAHVVAHFGVGDLLSREDLALGYVNWNCAVRTTQGRYFLKRRHPALADTGLVRAQHKLVAHVRAKGIPAPAIHAAPDGQSYLEHGGHVYELHTWAEGGRYDDQKAAHLAAAGDMLARYHLAARDFDAPEPLRRRQGWLYGPDVLERVVQWLEGRWTGLDEWWADLRARASTIAQAHPQHAAFSPLVIHGDYYANNLVFTGDRITALLDYDNAALQSRVVEVAEALIYFANQPNERLQVGVYDGVINLDKAVTFMSAYNAAWPLDATERAALPATVQAIWLTVSLRRLDEQQRATPAEAVARLRAARVLGDWAQTNHARLLEVAGIGAANR